MRETRGRIREISVEEFDEMIENHDDLLIVDVRAAGEFRRGHIPGALSFPRGTEDEAANDAGRVQIEQFLGRHQKTLVLYGQDGSDVAASAQALQRMGFEKVYCLAGGVNRWQAQGFALVTE